MPLRLNEAQRRRLRQVQRAPAEPDETGHESDESDGRYDYWDVCTSAASELYGEINERLRKSHDQLESLTEEFQGYLSEGRRACPCRRRVREEVAKMTRLAERIDDLLRFDPDGSYGSDSSDS